MNKTPAANIQNTCKTSNIGSVDWNPLIMFIFSFYSLGNEDVGYQCYFGEKTVHSPLWYSTEKGVAVLSSTLLSWGRKT